LGYAYATNWASRSAFKNSVEITVYLHHQQGGNGYGRMLYDKLIPLLSAGGFHVAIAAISLPNQASIKLHEYLGFTQVAHFKEIGHKFERWIDVGHWQLIL
ncbi:MAG: N-acetyltransferase family protein, partial [Psychromonas sp.]